jgi:hypothetical protein
MGISGPYRDFPCWAWDYDNDGWLDIFATSYDHTLGDIASSSKWVVALVVKISQYLVPESRAG